MSRFEGSKRHYPTKASISPSQKGERRGRGGVGWLTLKLTILFHISSTICQINKLMKLYFNQLLVAIKTYVTRFSNLGLKKSDVSSLLPLSGL